MSHILIVEDEPVIRGALRKLLERHDHSVTEAESVEQAREKGLSQCDLIISDLRLPGVAAGANMRHPQREQTRHVLRVTRRTNPQVGHNLAH